MIVDWLALYLICFNLSIEIQITRDFFKPPKTPS